MKAQVPFQKITYPASRYLGAELDMTHDGKYLATLDSAPSATANDVQIYELIDGQYELAAVQRFTFEVTNLKFSADGSKLLVGEGLSSIFRTATLSIMELADGGGWIKNPTIISDPAEPSAATGTSLAYSADGSRVALSIGSAGQVYIYDILSTTEAVQLGEPLTGAPFSTYFGGHVSLSEDGSRLAVSTSNPSITEVYEYIDNEWQAIYMVEGASGLNRLSLDGKSLLVSNRKRLTIHSQDTSGDWTSSASVELFTNTSFTWNLITCSFFPEYGHLSVGMLNATDQETKFASLDLFEDQWLERRGSLFDTHYTDYGGINVATSIDGSLLATSRQRANNDKGEIYVFNDLEGSAIGIAAYRDKNRNGIFDADEKFFTDCDFTINDDLMLIALEDYNYASAFGPSHTLRVNYDEDIYMATTADTYVFDHQSETITRHVFGLDFINPIAQSSIVSYNSLMLCNTSDDNKIIVHNTGTEAIYVEIEMNYSDISLLSSSADIISEQDSMILVRTPIIEPGEKYRITNVFQMPNELATGNLIDLHLSATTFDADNDQEVSTTDVDASFILRCSYDPNDKAVFPAGQTEELWTLIDQDLVYRVRFQNTGNFPATSVVVRDLISENLDLSTFRILESSHPLTQVSVRERLAEFKFENIMLADSVSNEPESHGYVTFSIRPVSDISDYTEIENTANIYFDFNAAIVTNTTISNMVEMFPVSSVNEGAEDDNTSHVYPNPVTNKLMIDINNRSTVSLYDANGQISKEIDLEAGDSAIDVQDLSPGIYHLRVTDRMTSNNVYHTFVKM